MWQRQENFDFEDISVVTLDFDIIICASYYLRSYFQDLEVLVLVACMLLNLSLKGHNKVNFKFFCFSRQTMTT